MRQAVLESLVSDQNLFNFELGKKRHNLRNDTATLNLEMMPSTPSKQVPDDEENDFDDFGATRVRRADTINSDERLGEKLSMKAGMFKPKAPPKQPEPTFLADLLDMNFTQSSPVK